MAKTVQLAIRVVPELVELLDQFAAQTTAELRKTLPGFSFSRVDAARVLMVDALEKRGFDVSRVQAAEDRGNSVEETPPEKPKPRGRKKVK
jgi:hypothetical protein